MLPKGVVATVVEDEHHTRVEKKLPKFGPNAVPGVFLGWHLHPGGEVERGVPCRLLA